MKFIESTQPKNSSEKSQKKPEIWLCLRFTHLSLNALGISAKANSGRAIAVSYQHAIWQCNEAARQSKIEPGMSVNHSLLLSPELQLIERDQQLETQKIKELSFWAYRFTSLLSQHKEHILLLEIGKSIKLFNSLDSLVNLVLHDLKSFNIENTLGIGATPKAASIVSHDNHSDLNSSLAKLKNADIGHLELDTKIIQKLSNCGFTKLHDLSAVPHAELGSRFGQETLLYLNQLWGKVADPQIGITPPETFHASANFAEPIHNFTWIQQQLERLLNDLAYFITSRQLICRSFTWRFYHENNRLIKTITIGVNAKQNLKKVFKELTDLKLASIKLDWEFSCIELSSTQLHPIQLFNDDLFDPQPNQEQFKQLIDKLSSRLGHNALFRLSVEDEYLPELANGQRHAAQEVNENATTYLAKPKENSLKDEPLWLLETPKQLRQFQGQAVLDGSINIIHGPNRIVSHWWAKLQSRDYFIAHQRNGRLIWIFFDRGQRQWFLHGLFA